jgi:diguanylate cyclase (GGDEF)-like protein
MRFEAVRRMRRPGVPLAVMLGSPVVFATGVGARPAGAVWHYGYDLVVYNAVYLAAAALCWQAAARSPRERSAWRPVSLALVLYSVGEIISTTILPLYDEQPYPSVADVFYLAYYPLIYVAVLRLVRARVPRFHTSMWLDGVIGALGGAAVAVAGLLGPSLNLTDGPFAVIATNLAYPVADLLLLALLVGIASALGLRSDRALFLLGLGLVFYLVADIVYLDLTASDAYTEGGLVDLGWMLGTATAGLAAVTVRSSSAAPRLATASGAASARVGWRVLTIPMVCNAASLSLLGLGFGDRFPPAAGWCAVACIVVSLVRTALTFRDIRGLREVSRQARTDELTGLANRRALLEEAHRAMAEATAERPIALLLLDLDGFKAINDRLGHQAGDELLRQIAPRLRSAVREDDLCARLGGDEFAVLLIDTPIDAARHTAERIVERLRVPYAIGRERVHVGASAGVASAPLPARDVAELLRCADIAMYAAKAAGSGVQAFADQVPEGTPALAGSLGDIGAALLHDQLLVHLQPEISLRDGSVAAAEAFVRWEHPTRGLLSPADVLPAAEQAGLLPRVATAVLELALDAAAHWWRGGARFPVSVNLGARSVTDPQLPARITAALDARGLPGEALKVELVEDVLSTQPEAVREVLSQLRASGVQVAIDDYGAGYSSLARLRHLPVDELKLDRSFTADADTIPQARATVAHLVALAHTLDLRVVAEGVEEIETAQLLASLGCDVVQGYSIARPMPVEEFLHWHEEVRPDFSRVRSWSRPPRPANLATA